MTGTRECLEQSSLDHSGGSLEDQHAKRHAESGGLASEVSEVSNDCTGSCTEDHWGYNPAKNLGAFFSCLESLVDVEFKTKGLSCWGQKNARVA